MVIELLPDALPLFGHLLLRFVDAGEVHVVFVGFLSDEMVPQFELRLHRVAVVVDEELIHSEGQMISDPFSEEHHILDHPDHALNGEKVLLRLFERQLSLGRLLSAKENHNYFGLGRNQI